MAGVIANSFRSGKPTRTQVAWTSDASGDVSGDSVRLEGAIVRVCFIPDPTDVPTANYDVSLMLDGIDLLAGEGQNLSASAASQVCPAAPFTDGTTVSLAPPAVNDDVEVVVENAGNAKKGKVVIYTR